MLIIGILFILIGIYVIISDKYVLKIVGGMRELSIREDYKKDRLHRYKLALAVLSIVVGAFSILNYIIY